MKKSMTLTFACISILIIFFGCNKEDTDAGQTQVVRAEIKPKPDTCANVSSKGRVIGVDPCINFMNFDTGRFARYDSTLGSGFVIEIDNGTTKDTALTYRLPATIFQFQSSNFESGTTYLFKRQIQDSFKIKFNYKIVPTSDRTEVHCVTIVFDVFLNSILFDLHKKRKEIILSCVSPQ